MTSLIRDLNLEQKEAVKHERGPLLVLAGPGTGKTRVLTRRLAYLIQKEFCQPSEILALTFTQKAAQEMTERVDELFPDQYLDLPVHTFHGFAQQLIEKHGLEMGISNSGRIVTTQDLRILLGRNWSRFTFKHYQPRGDNSALISALIAHFGRCKDEAIGPKDYLKSFREKSSSKEETARRKELADAYRIYQELLLEKNALDFGDLLYYSYQFLKNNSHWREYYQKKIKYLLIDEFQDTNKIQYELIRLLVNKDQNITVCASADQTIYQWRGAYYGNVDRFLSDYSKAKTIILKNNYRSTQNLIDLSQSFIAQNKEFGRLSKEDDLRAARKGKGQVKIWQFRDKKSELRGISEEIARLIQEEKIDPEKIAILARTNEGVRAFEEHLRRLNLPVQSLASGEIYRQPIVLDLIAYLSLLVDRYDNVSFHRYLDFSCWKLSESDKSRLIHESRRRGMALADSIHEQNLLKELSPSGQQSAQRLIKFLDRKADLSIEKIIDFLEESGYLKNWLRLKPSQSEAEALNLFLEQLTRFSENHFDLNLSYFLDEIEWERMAGGMVLPINEPGKVKIMTVHAAKGLQFDYVFLVGLTNQTFPSRRQFEPIPWLDQSKEAEDHLREERRLFFVAMTRARHNLYFSWSEDHGSSRMRKPSCFLLEMGLVEIAEAKETKAIDSKIKKNSLPSYSLPTYFSYTQLAGFRKCPYQYQMNHILKIVTRGGPARSFGVTMHQVLAVFMQKWTEDPVKANWSILKQIYKECWVDEWYQDNKQRQEYRVNGQKCLQKFYQNLKKDFPQVYGSEDGLWLEKAFKGKIAEYPFRGKIDRVDLIGEGLELIDYKTGHAPKKLSWADKEQLIIYQLAANEILKIKPTRLTLHYLMDNQKISFLGTEKDLQKVENSFKRTVAQIQESNFQATPGFHCRFCDFRLTCPFRR